MVIQDVLRTMRKRGTSNQLVCRFFEFFWFCRENRVTHKNDKYRGVRVVYVISFRVFRVDQLGARKMIWLDYGYSFPRQLFIVIGEFLHRYSPKFAKWNRERCSKCLHDQFKTRSYDVMGGTICEQEEVCAKCTSTVYSFSYGHTEEFWTTKWERWENRIFGELKPDQPM